MIRKYAAEGEGACFKKVGLWCVVSLSALVLFGCSERFDKGRGTYIHKGKGLSIQFPAG